MWSVRPRQDKNRVVLNDGTKPISGFLDMLVIQGAQESGPKLDLLRQALYREAGMWRSMALTETGCQQEPLALTTNSGFTLPHCSTYPEIFKVSEATAITWLSGWQERRRMP